MRAWHVPMCEYVFRPPPVAQGEESELSDLSTEADDDRQNED